MASNHESPGRSWVTIAKQCSHKEQCHMTALFSDGHPDSPIYPHNHRPVSIVTQEKVEVPGMLKAIGG